MFRSSKHIYAQVIDDIAGVTVAAASSIEKDMRGNLKTGGGWTKRSGADSPRPSRRRPRSESSIMQTVM